MLTGAVFADDDVEYRTFQVAVDAVAQLTGLDLEQFAAADRLPTRQGSLPAQPIELTGSDDLVF